MKIAFVSAAQSSHTVKWVNALAQRGHTVRLYSLPDHADKQKSIDPNVQTVLLKHSGFSGYFRNAKQLKREIESFKPDIVNAHYASGYGTLARLSHVHPLLLSVWGSDVYLFPYKSPLHKKLIADNIHYADAVASTSQVMAEQVRRLFGSKKRIFITPFGVDCQKFAPQEKTEKKVFVVGAVKSLEPPYGMDDLIRAFYLFLKRLPPDTENVLDIYGKGSMNGSLQQLINSLNLKGKAFLRGAIPNTDVPYALNNMDVVCLPSISESFGVSAIEAMACGIPVVASDADGFLETVKNNVTGFTVPKRNPEAMAEKIYLLEQNSELRRKMGKAGRKYVMQFYDLNKNVEIMDNVYNTVIRSATASM